jgi:hypothetical protein
MIISLVLVCKMEIEEYERKLRMLEQRVAFWEQHAVREGMVQ